MKNTLTSLPITFRYSARGPRRARLSQTSEHKQISYCWSCAPPPLPPVPSLGNWRSERGIHGALAGSSSEVLVGLEGEGQPEQGDCSRTGGQGSLLSALLPSSFSGSPFGSESSSSLSLRESQAHRRMTCHLLGRTSPTCHFRVITGLTVEGDSSFTISLF